jgi:hypothetical protein
MKWPRYIEMLLGAWLILSAWVVEHPDPAVFQAVAITAGVIIIVLDIAAIVSPRRLAYLGIVAVAFGLLAFGYLSEHPESQGVQSTVSVGLFLLMFAILPTEATLPPASWRDYNARKR